MLLSRSSPPSCARGSCGYHHCVGTFIPWHTLAFAVPHDLKIHSDTPTYGTHSVLQVSVATTRMCIFLDGPPSRIHSSSEAVCTCWIWQDSAVLSPANPLPANRSFVCAATAPRRAVSPGHDGEHHSPHGRDLHSWTKAHFQLLSPVPSRGIITTLLLTLKLRDPCLRRYFGGGIAIKGERTDKRKRTAGQSDVAMGPRAVIGDARDK